MSYRGSITFSGAISGVWDGFGDIVVTLNSHASSHDAGGDDEMAIDAAPDTGSLRTLGNGQYQAMAGNTDLFNPFEIDTPFGGGFAPSRGPFQ